MLVVLFVKRKTCQLASWSADILAGAPHGSAARDSRPRGPAGNPLPLPVEAVAHCTVPPSPRVAPIAKKGGRCAPALRTRSDLPRSNPTEM